MCCVSAPPVTPPYKPEVLGATDTSNFDPVETQQATVPPPRSSSTFAGNHLPFLGFSFTGGCGLSAAAPAPSVAVMGN